ncbi:MAG: DUF4091 domain-containing protein [Ruminococcaceae bacterium]|nr:DUF4091 domain-containing protein [Oscillospiraceae bacterium]
MELKQISSLIKLRTPADLSSEEKTHKLMLKGSTFSYQLAVHTDVPIHAEITLTSPISDFVTIYAVRDVLMDYPKDPNNSDDDYLTDTPGLMPDLLEPIDQLNQSFLLKSEVSALWVEVTLPETILAGTYPITISLCYQRICEPGKHYRQEKTMQIEVLDIALPKPELIFTQWLHVDCIASAHNTEIYTKRHWELIDRYLEMAARLGINMILTPVITPPLDTDIGTRRPCTQLVQIEKKGEKYTFDFSLLTRWINLCQKHHIERFEICHLFSQWGAAFAPNIEVTENGEKTLLFGWHISSDDARYTGFLKQFIPALVDFFQEKGIAKNCYFHISDEPEPKHIDVYKKAYNLIKPLIGDCQTIDALSDYEFYKNGLVENPVCASDFIEPFLEHKTERLWAYYCCAQGKSVSNRFLAMPSYRNRIIGLQLYKFGLKGFLHWGYNFYNCWRSRYAINPYTTTSAEHAMQSGDPFSVYPGKDGPLPSLRAMIFREALQDICICRLLEQSIGREKIIALIDAEKPLTFSEYPRNNDYIEKLTEQMLCMISTQKGESSDV